MSKDTFTPCNRIRITSTSYTQRCEYVFTSTSAKQKTKATQRWGNIMGIHLPGTFVPPFTEKECNITTCAQHTSSPHEEGPCEAKNVFVDCHLKLKLTWDITSDIKVHIFETTLHFYNIPRK